MNAKSVAELLDRVCDPAFSKFKATMADLWPKMSSSHDELLSKAKKLAVWLEEAYEIMTEEEDQLADLIMHKICFYESEYLRLNKAEADRLLNDPSYTSLPLVRQLNLIRSKVKGVSELYEQFAKHFKELVEKRDDLASKLGENGLKASTHESFTVESTELEALQEQIKALVDVRNERLQLLNTYAQELTKIMSRCQFKLPSSSSMKILEDNISKLRDPNVHSAQDDTLPAELLKPETLSKMRRSLDKMNAVAQTLASRADHFRGKIRYFVDLYGTGMSTELADLLKLTANSEENVEKLERGYMKLVKNRQSQLYSEMMVCRMEIDKFWNAFCFKDEDKLDFQAFFDRPKEEFTDELLKRHKKYLAYLTDNSQAFTLIRDWTETRENYLQFEHEYSDTSKYFRRKGTKWEEYTSLKEDKIRKTFVEKLKKLENEIEAIVPENYVFRGFKFGGSSSFSSGKNNLKAIEPSRLVNAALYTPENKTTSKLSPGNRISHAKSMIIAAPKKPVNPKLLIKSRSGILTISQSKQSTTPVSTAPKRLDFKLGTTTPAKLTGTKTTKSISVTPAKPASGKPIKAIGFTPAKSTSAIFAKPTFAKPVTTNLYTSSPFYNNVPAIKVTDDQGRTSEYNTLEFKKNWK